MGKCYINEEVWLLCSESPDTPVKLKNTHAPNVIMHGFLPATEKDNAFGFNIGPFGKCNRRGEDCSSYIQRQLTEWYDLPATNVSISGARPLDENSKCFCKSGLGTINIFLSKEAALNSGIQPDFVLPSELDSFLTTGMLVFGLVKGIPALATAAQTGFQAGKVAVDFTAGLGTVIWTMDKVQDKIYGAMLYLGADPSLTGDIMDFFDNLGGVFQNYTDGQAYLSLALAAGDLAVHGDVKPNGRLYSDTDGNGGRKSIFSEKADNHLVNTEGFGKKHTGIRGGHNSKNFNKFGEKRPIKQFGEMRFSDIDGIYEIDYTVSKITVQGDVISGEYYNNKYRKTLYDPEIISDDTMKFWAREALTNSERTISRSGQIYVKGEAKNGLKFEGWINPKTDKLDSYYPVLEWTK